MKKIIIKVHKFGPLKNVQFQLAPFMIFTGKSKLGKSYANYLTYYFFNSLLDFEEMTGFYKEFAKDQDSGEFIITEEMLSSYLNEHVENFMRSFLGDPDLECHLEYQFLDFGNPISVSYQKIKVTEEDREKGAKDLVRLTINGDSFSQRVFLSVDTTVALSLKFYIFRILSGYSYMRALLFPPANGALVNADYSIINSVVQDNKRGMYNRFLLDNNYCTTCDETESKSDYFSSIQEIVGGDIITKNNKEYLVLSDGKHINMSAAASSIKEISPLLYLLNNNPEARASVCLEEPEAHLHPSMQIAVADLIAQCINRNYIFTITTHSDYFLDRINQLIKLGNIRAKDKEKFNAYSVKNCISPLVFIDSSMVKAYYFHQENTSSQVIIDDLSINEGGIPMLTFFETVTKMREQDEEINALLFNC